MSIQAFLSWYDGVDVAVCSARERTSDDSYLSKWLTMGEGPCSFSSSTLCNPCLNQGSILDWRWSVWERGLESVLCWLVLLGVIATQFVGQFRWANEAFSRMWAIDRLINMCFAAVGLVSTCTIKSHIDVNVCFSSEYHGEIQDKPLQQRYVWI